MKGLWITKFWCSMCLFASIIAYTITKDVDTIVFIVSIHALLLGSGWFFYTSVKLIVWHVLDEEEERTRKVLKKRKDF